MVFQGAMNSLSPVTKIGKQLEDVYTTHLPEDEQCPSAWTDARNC